MLANDRTQSADMMYHENDDLSSNEIEPAAPVAKKKGHKVASEQYSTTEISKGNDLNMAMKYRTYREHPKHVEVWTSKIHRNGLFAC